MVASIIIVLLAIAVFLLWFSPLGLKAGIWGGEDDKD